MGLPPILTLSAGAATTSNPKRYVKLGRCAVRANLNILTKSNIVGLSEAENPAPSKTHIQFRSNRLSI
jgi:hypothetical protein